MGEKELPGYATGWREGARIRDQGLPPGMDPQTKARRVFNNIAWNGGKERYWDGFLAGFKRAFNS